MARHVATTLVSDLSGSTENVKTVSFTFERAQYDVELDELEREEFRRQMEPYIKAGRRRRGNPSSSGKLASGHGQLIREWARSNGKTVSDYGRIPAAVMQEYWDAHQGASR